MSVLVSEKALCCGCSACYDICPKSAISMVEDSEGFLYPTINKDKCVNCGLCEKVCPTQNKQNSQSLMKAFAAYNTDQEIRLQSSSGGLFTLFAESILGNNGVVYGAAFDDNFEVEHIRITNVENLNLLRGSKYVQSKLDGIFKLCKNDLEINKYVLFTGTPCQVAALKSYLKKDYVNLFCMDIICHGVPSRMVWRQYLEYRVNFAKSKIAQIAFRLKNEGWKQYAVKFTFANSTAYCQKFQDDVFMNGFLKDLYLRPSCYNCQFKTKERVSDFTVADFWGIDKIHPEWDDDKGMTLLIVHSLKGNDLVESVKEKLFLKDVNLDEAISYNSSMTKSVAMNKKREAFFKENINANNIEKIIGRYIKAHYSLRKRLSIWLRSRLRRMFKKNK